MRFINIKLLLILIIFLISCSLKVKSNFFIDKWISLYSTDLVEISNRFDDYHKIYHDPSLLFKLDKSYQRYNPSVILKYSDVKSLAKCYLKINKNQNFRIVEIKEFKNLWIVHALRQIKNEKDNNILIISKYNGELVLNRHEILEDSNNE